MEQGISNVLFPIVAATVAFLVYYPLIMLAKIILNNPFNTFDNWLYKWIDKLIKN